MYTNADFKISLYVRYLKTIPWKFANLILRVFELFTCRVCEMFVYKHTEIMEYIKK